MRSVRRWQNLFSDNILFLISIAVLLLLRFLMLENKPIHHDEAVNAWWLTQISELGYFPYDPTNYHGPLFFYVQWILTLIFGEELWVLRLGAVLFSVLTVGILVKRNCKWAALLMALSPAFFFFSRSAIHESMFVFFQLLMLLGFLDWVAHKSRGFELFLLGLLGSLAVKETWALSFISLIVAGVATKTFPRWQDIKEDQKRILQMIALVVVAWFIIFTGFFQDLSGALNFFKAFMPWLHTGTGGSGHDKSFNFWIDQLLQNETLISLVIFFSVFLLWKHLVSLKTSAKHFMSSQFQFIYIFSLVQFLIYSWIPYKTIWCFIAILWPICLLADELMEKIPYRKTVFVISLVLVAWQSQWIYKLNFQNPILFDHPYVYVQTSQEVKNFGDRVNPEWSVLVARKDMWPFPWILRKNQKVRYFPEISEQEDRESLIKDKDLIIADQESLEKLKPFIQNWKEEMFYLRDGANEVFIFQRNP